MEKLFVVTFKTPKYKQEVIHFLWAKSRLRAYFKFKKTHAKKTKVVKISLAVNIK